jgi:hypothetical protein
MVVNEVLSWQNSITVSFVAYTNCEYFHVVINTEKKNSEILHLTGLGSNTWLSIYLNFRNYEDG